MLFFVDLPMLRVACFALLRGRDQFPAFEDRLRFCQFDLSLRLFDFQFPSELPDNVPVDPPTLCYVPLNLIVKVGKLFLQLGKKILT